MMTFRTKTTDSILSVFTKTIQELKAHADKSTAKGNDLAVKASELSEKSYQQLAEAAKAASYAQKLEKFLGQS